MASDLLIKINADAKNAQKAFDDIRDQTEDLENQLSKVATVSAIAFAAFTSEIFFSAKAFEEAAQASGQLTNALQNQGIYTQELKEQYEEFADVVQAKTGIDNDAIIKAQAVAQTYLGQTKITQELTTAIADLGASMDGDLNGAAEKIARTIGTGTNAFAKQGLVIDASATEAERYAKVLEFVSTKASGLAEEFNRTDGYAKALATSFGNFQEAIGSRFAPVIAAIRQAFVTFFDYISSSPVLTDLVVAFVTAGAVVSGLIAFLAAAVPAFLALKAAVVAFGLAMNVAFVGIPLAIAAVVAAVTLLALNWDKVMASLKAAAQAAVTLISEQFTALGKILDGVLTFDSTKIQDGVKQLVSSFAKAKEAAIETYTEIRLAQQEEGIKQDEGKKALADKEAARERQHQANLRAIKKAELDLTRLQNEDASAQAIALKQREIEVLKALDSDKSAAELALYQERYEKIKTLQDEQRQQDLEREQEFALVQEEARAELAQRGIDTQAALSDARLAELRATAQTELDIDRKLQEDLLTRKIAAQNQELLEKKKFGIAYATINRFIQSEEVAGAKNATSELVALSQSKNQSLKEIGKGAAVAQITMKSAESAMNIYNGFSIIPIVGPALGVAGAAAAIAFGAEQIGQVTAAADGGLMTGGISGKDSIPTLTMPGELIVPTRNFDEVVGAVQTQREGGGSEVLAVLQRIEEKFSAPQQTIIQGDVTGDDSFIDSLVRRISDALEFRNGKLYGVNS